MHCTILLLLFITTTTTTTTKTRGLGLNTAGWCSLLWQCAFGGYSLLVYSAVYTPAQPLLSTTVSSCAGPKSSDGIRLIYALAIMPGDPVDPRVACATITHAGAADAAKSHGTDTPTFSWMRKRAFRRAHGRAARNPSGGTFYIGQWCTTADLQGRKAMPRLSGTTSSQAQQVTRSDQTGRHKQRLRIMTYNVGGCSSDLYDTLCLYLRENTDLDILFLQELHWGLGREETTWVIPGWMFIVAPDPQRRYSGV